MINFLNLEYFLVASEELNFTRAAKQLYISQQSLSSHILNLEKEFGVALFNRTPSDSDLRRPGTEKKSPADDTAA